MKIKKPVCPNCGGKDLRIMRVEAPGYYEILVIYACWDCKERFKSIIKMED